MTIEDTSAPLSASTGKNQRSMSLIDFVRQMDGQPTHCTDDGFPLISIDGEIYCTVEYADGLIGGQKAVGVAQGEHFIEILLANGYLIPLTCPCCGGQLHLRDMQLPELRALLIGRSIEGFRHGEWVGEGVPPKRHPVFALQFSGSEERQERTIEVALESVRGIRKANASPAPH
ncbi:MAG: hypothetical protein H0V47_08905 [Chloroflexia bacterium]|nr:hypothetical protein [Chloroflexia bacterium]